MLEPSTVLPLRMTSIVVRGYGRGSADLGIPTANLDREAGRYSLDSFEDLPTGTYANTILPPAGRGTTQRRASDKHMDVSRRPITHLALSFPLSSVGKFPRCSRLCRHLLGVLSHRRRPIHLQDGVQYWLQPVLREQSEDSRTPSHRPAVRRKTARKLVRGKFARRLLRPADTSLPGRIFAARIAL